jgi:hypothetical protein
MLLGSNLKNTSLSSSRLAITPRDAAAGWEFERDLLGLSDCERQKRLAAFRMN